MMRPGPARYLPVAALLLSALAVAGCGEDDAPALCSAVDDLKASIDEVTTVDLDEGALSELQDNLSQVRSDLTTVENDAKDEFASEIDSVEQASDSLGSSVEAAIASPSAESIAEVGAAVEALGATLSALQDAATSTC